MKARTSKMRLASFHGAKILFAGCLAFVMQEGVCGSLIPVVCTDIESKIPKMIQLKDAQNAILGKVQYVDDSVTLDGSADCMYVFVISDPTSSNPLNLAEKMSDFLRKNVDSIKSSSCNSDENNRIKCTLK